jgi:hypothetical protein
MTLHPVGVVVKTVSKDEIIGTMVLNYVDYEAEGGDPTN